MLNVRAINSKIGVSLDKPFPTMKNTKSQTFTQNWLSASSSMTCKLALAFVSLAYGIQGHAQSNTSVLVIDAGVDTAHTKLSGYVNENLAEKNGQAGKDDDGDGFVDNVAGWNAVSNDAVYMPKYILNKFTATPAQTQGDLDLYSGAEKGDAAAIADLKAHPEKMTKIGDLLELAHGTHVAGIIAGSSVVSARIQSLNVFNGSTEEKPGNTTAGAPSMRALLGRMGSLKNLALADLHALTQPDDLAQPQTAAAGSFLDSRAQLTALLAKMEKDNTADGTVLINYIKASKARVANLSLGIGIVQIYERFINLWQQELTEAGKDPNTAMSATQKDNFLFLVKGMFGVSNRGWQRVFSSNPNTLFVIAAGNDGSADNPTAGDIAKYAVTPAILSATLPNVITVSATNPAGVIADFSCFSALHSNIGAWGTAVPSLAPGDLNVTMSGTSMAAPYVTGVASRIRALNNRLTPAEVRQLIEKTGKQVASLKGKTTSGALIDAQAAFDAATASNNGVVLASAISSAVEKRDAAAFGSLTLGNFATASVKSRSNMETMLREALSQADTSAEGEVFRTSDLVRSNLRHFDQF